jgi:hypothetical protein
VRRMRMLWVVLLALLTTPLYAEIIYVHPGGSGDYSTLPEGVANATIDDTVLVAAGLYSVSCSGWPIVLHSASPTIMSEDGAEATVIRWGAPFETMSGDYECRVRIVGFTIRETATPLCRSGEDYARFLFTDNVIIDNYQGLDASQGNGLIARNLISNNGERGIYTYHYWGVIEDNEVCGHVRGIVGACCESPTVRRNHIHHNTVTGSAPGIDAHQIENLVEHNGTGLYVGYGGEAQSNIVRYNEIGVRFNGTGTIPFHGNDLYENTLYNLKLDDCWGGPLDATMNWWGTTDPEEIAASIWDAEDDPDIGCYVAFGPWCPAPGCDPVAVDPASWGAIKAMYR